MALFEPSFWAIWICRLRGSLRLVLVAAGMAFVEPDLPGNGDCTQPELSDSFQAVYSSWF